MSQAGRYAETTNQAAQLGIDPNTMIAINKSLSKTNLIDQEKYKTNFDTSLENGPAQDRGCTDIICCIIFLLFLGGWIFIFGYGLAKGKPQALLTPFDESGNGCGYSPGFEDFENIYFYSFGKTEQELAASNPTNATQYYAKTFCVSRCPTDAEYDETTAKSISSVGIACKTTAGKNTEENRDCGSYLVYKTTVWLGTFCVPNIKVIKDSFNATASAAS